MLKRFLAWLRGVFGGKPAPLALPAPTVARPPDAPAPTPAPVKTRGRWRKHQRREAVRDARLLAKPPSTRAWNQPAPKVIPVGEARRLFAGTQRTRNQDLRTLATDRAQLAAYGLPVWDSELDLAKALGITVGTLRHFSIHRQRERVPHYLAYAIPKRSGGTRIIHAPKQRLKAILRTVQRELVGKLPVSTHAHGFVTGRSVKTGALPHVRKQVVMRLDLADFFGTVTMARVRGYLIALGYGYPVATTLATLCTEAERQPVDVDGILFHVPVGPRTCVQGAPTSPGLCNAIVHKLDRRIAALAARAGFAFTRYADDLTFSGDSVNAAHKLRKQVERVIAEEGFVVNTKKTRIMTRGGRQRVTGVTVNKVLGLSRTERRKIRAMLHKNDPAQHAHVQGLLAWVEMLNPEQAAKLRAQSTRSARSNSSGFEDA